MSTVSFIPPDDPFSDTSMLAKAPDTWYTFSIKIVCISMSSGSVREDINTSVIINFQNHRITVILFK